MRVKIIKNTSKLGHIKYEKSCYISLIFNDGFRFLAHSDVASFNCCRNQEIDVHNGLIFSPSCSLTQCECHKENNMMNVNV